MTSRFTRATLLASHALMLVLVTSLALAEPPASHAHEPSSSIQVVHPYVRAVPPGMTNSAAFMLLRNTSDAAATLVSASAPVAATVELHTHAMSDGVMRMRRLSEIRVPSRTDVELKPGGLHLMLIGLKQDLKPGMQIPIVLRLADGREVHVTAPVR